MKRFISWNIQGRFIFAEDTLILKIFFHLKKNREDKNQVGRQVVFLHYASLF